MSINLGNIQSRRIWNASAAFQKPQSTVSISSAITPGAGAGPQKQAGGAGGARAGGGRGGRDTFIFFFRFCLSCTINYFIFNLKFNLC